MALKANYEFLFFGRDDNSFLENYSYDLFQEHGDKSGQIFINLEVQNNQADAEEIGKALFESVQKFFFEDIEKDPYERFEVALKECNKVLTVFKSEKCSRSIGNLKRVIAAIVGENLYLTQSGDAEAYMIRKKYVSIISEGLSDEDAGNDDVFMSIASGKIEPNDIVLFSSTRLLRYLPKTELAKCLNKKNLNEDLNDIKDAVSTEILGRVGLTGIIFETANKEDVAGINVESDSVAKNVLESDHDEVFSQKETLTGRFITAFKNYKKRRPSDVVSRSGDDVFGYFSSIGRIFKDFYNGLFDKGFGKNKILALLVIIIIVLIFGIWITKGNMAEKQQIEKLNKTLTSVAEKISEAETKSSYDKDQAKIVLDKAYTDALSVLNSGYYREKANLYLIQIEKTRDSMDNVKRITSPKVLADLSKKRTSVSALGFANINDRMFVYEYNALYELVLNQVQDPLTIDDKEVVISATNFEDRDSILFLTKSGKLIEYKDGAVSYMDTDDGVFHKGVALEDWSNKVYVLDSASNQVWKYTYKGTMGKFSGAESYLVEPMDLSKAQDLAIDSNIYMLLKNGDINKFYSGKKAPFFINNPPFNTLKSPKVIYTNEKLDDIYVLDSKDAKVLIYKKDPNTGNIIYQSQLLFENTGELRDLYVDADSKKLYVLSGSKVYEEQL